MSKRCPDRGRCRKQQQRLCLGEQQWPFHMEQRQGQPCGGGMNRDRELRDHSSNLVFLPLPDNASNGERNVITKPPDAKAWCLSYHGYLVDWHCRVDCCAPKGMAIPSRLLVLTGKSSHAARIVDILGKPSQSMYNEL